MGRTFLIDHERITIEEDDGTIRSVLVADVVNQLNADSALDPVRNFCDDELFAPAVRWVSRDGASIILERPAEQSLVAFNGIVRILPVPWTLWCFRLDNTKIIDLRLLARQEPLYQANDLVYQFPYPNTDLNGHVFVDVLEELMDLIDARRKLTKTSSIANLMSVAIDQYWQMPVSANTAWKDRLPRHLDGPYDLDSAYEALSRMRLLELLGSELVVIDTVVKAFPPPAEDHGPTRLPKGLLPGLTALFALGEKP